MPPEVMTMKQAAAYLGIHRQTAYNLAQDGKLPCQKVGGQWRFRRSVLERWLEGGNGRAGGTGDRRK